MLVWKYLLEGRYNRFLFISRACLPLQIDILKHMEQF